MFQVLIVAEEPPAMEMLGSGNWQFIFTTPVVGLKLICEHVNVGHRQDEKYKAQNL